MLKLTSCSTSVLHVAFLIAFAQVVALQQDLIHNVKASAGWVAAARREGYNVDSRGQRHRHQSDNNHLQRLNRHRQGRAVQKNAPIIGIKLFSWLANSTPSSAPSSAPTIPALAPCTIKTAMICRGVSPRVCRIATSPLLLHHHHAKRGNNVKKRQRRRSGSAAAPSYFFPSARPGTARLYAHASPAIWYLPAASVG